LLGPDLPGVLHLRQFSKQASGIVRTVVVIARKPKALVYSVSPYEIDELRRVRK
jgi:hypothetical protein